MWSLRGHGPGYVHSHVGMAVFQAGLSLSLIICTLYSLVSIWAIFWRCRRAPPYSFFPQFTPANNSVFSLTSIANESPNLLLGTHHHDLHCLWEGPEAWTSPHSVSKEGSSLGREYKVFQGLLFSSQAKSLCHGSGAGDETVRASLCVTPRLWEPNTQCRRQGNTLRSCWLLSECGTSIFPYETRTIKTRVRTYTYC